MVSKLSLLENKKNVYAVLSSQVFRDTIDRFKRKVLKVDTNVPWMRHREIDFIRQVLISLKPQKCLEWGAGYSTLDFPSYIPEGGTWVSVEHDQSWANKIIALNKSGNVNIVFIPPEKFPFADKFGEGCYDELVKYIEFPSKEKYFDFILIDGRARIDCLKKCHDILGEKGVVILHDANRIEYHDVFNLFPNTFLLSDYRKIVGGLWVGSNNLRIDEIVDVEKNLTMWGIYKKFGSIIRL